MSSKKNGGVLWTQTAKGSFPNVNVSLNSACQAPLCYSDWTYGEWTMELQRFNPHPPNWVTIGKRTGYVLNDSPSHRTFTNVVNKGSIRVKTVIRDSIYHDKITLIDYVN